MNSAQVFAAIWSTCVVILGIGVLWFFVARPILAAFGIVSDYADDAPEIMSSTGSDTPSAGAGTGAGDVVLPHQHQVAPASVPTFEAVKRYLTEHTLTDDEAIALLALARRIGGDDLISANKIRDIVGGNEGKVKAHVATFRSPRPKSPPATRLERPKNGWEKTG